MPPFWAALLNLMGDKRGHKVEKRQISLPFQKLYPKIKYYAKVLCPVESD
jgi:hypothetical protein